MSKTRILVIEDNRLLRDGLVALINGQADMRVVTASGRDENTLLKARSAKAQVILVDLGLRDQNSVRLLALLLKEIPELKVIGIGLFPTQSDVVEFVKAGASGFILKDATVKEFLKTIRSVAQGENVIPPPLTDSLFSHVVKSALKKENGHPGKAVQMTKREREIIALIADALSNKEIAGQLNIATYTVKSHVHNILEKLAMHSRMQIAKYTNDEIQD